MKNGHCRIGSPVTLGLPIGGGVMLILITTAFTSAADQVFKALLYNYATGRTLPVGIHASTFGEAIGVKK